MDDSLKDLNDFLLSNCSEDIISSVIEHNHLSITIVFSSLEKITSLLKINNICKFRTLIDITAIDYPEQEERFCLVYHYLSMQQNIRIRVKSSIKEGQIVPSITKLFSAGTVEQEALEILVHKKKMQEQEKQLQDMLNIRFGYGTWKEMIELRRKIRKER